MFTFGQKLLFRSLKKLLFFALVGGACFAQPKLTEAQEVDLSQQQYVGLYEDVFNENIYYEIVDYLSFSTLYRKVTRKKEVAANVNIYDEVADSPFFTNRHARKRLTAAELTQGAATKGAPDLRGPLVVMNARAEGLNPVFFVQNQQGDVYLLKFDPPDNLELATSAEVIASRFYYALGYNVPQSHIAYVEASQFTSLEGARFYDHTGFKHPLSQEAIEELLLFIPYAEDGTLRVSAHKLLAGAVKGTFKLRGRDRSDPEDLVLHQSRRELRALRVFSSWLNNYDVRRGNTLQMIVSDSGGAYLKNYILNYNATLGAGFHDAKPPMFVHEHLFDYGEAAKAYFKAGFGEKPWQKRWREADKQVGSAAVGYFDNRYFDPAKFKVQLPSRAFKNLTDADAFWAAKTVMAFTDEDIRTLVKTGQYSKQEDEDTIAAVLSERRDLIGRYWFNRVSPLDEFDVVSSKLIFTDLAVKFGFEPPTGTIYRTEVLGKRENKKSPITVLEGVVPEVTMDDTWLETADSIIFIIQAIRPSEDKAHPGVTIELSRDGILNIAHA